MTTFTKPLVIALTAVAFTLASVSMPALAMSTSKAEKIIMKAVKKNAKRVEKISKPVAEAAMKGEGALQDFCTQDIQHTELCIEVALALAL